MEQLEYGIYNYDELFENNGNIFKCYLNTLILNEKYYFNHVDFIKIDVSIDYCVILKIFSYDSKQVAELVVEHNENIYLLNNGKINLTIKE
jgi:hypothetical protein